MEEKYINLIEEWCEVLEQKAFARYHGPHSKDQKTSYYWFKINKKYTKIIVTNRGSDSVHAFVDNNTLDIYKSANWNAPVKDKRYHLVDDFNELLQVCDPHGSYLYKRKAKVYV